MRESGLGAGGPGQRRPRRGQCLAFKERGTGRVTVAHSIFKSLELKYAENLKTWWFPSINFPFSKRSSECWPHPHCKETVWDLKSTANPPAPGSRGSRGTGQAGGGGVGPPRVWWTASPSESLPECAGGLAGVREGAGLAASVGSPFQGKWLSPRSPPRRGCR